MSSLGYGERGTGLNGLEMGMGRSAAWALWSSVSTHMSDIAKHQGNRQPLVF